MSAGSTVKTGKGLKIVGTPETKSPMEAVTASPNAASNVMTVPRRGKFISAPETASYRKSNIEQHWARTDFPSRVAGKLKIQHGRFPRYTSTGRLSAKIEMLVNNPVIVSFYRTVASFVWESFLP